MEDGEAKLLCFVTYTTRKIHYSIGLAKSLKNATGSLPVQAKP